MELELSKESFYLVSPDFTSEFCQNLKYLEKIALIIHLYSIPFVSKSYDYILKALSSNPFWVHFGPVLLNFVKITLSFSHRKPKKQIYFLSVLKHVSNMSKMALHCRYSYEIISYDYEDDVFVKNKIATQLLLLANPNK